MKCVIDKPVEKKSMVRGDMQAGADNISVIKLHTFSLPR